MRFDDILNRYKKREITTMEAADLLGISQSTFLRKRIRYEEEGPQVQFDRRIGRKSSRCAEAAEVKRITKLYEQHYQGFSVKHFHEFAQRKHGLKYGYTWCKRTLIQAGLVRTEKRGGPHRQRRPRKPLINMVYSVHSTQTEVLITFTQMKPVVGLFPVIIRKWDGH